MPPAKWKPQRKQSINKGEERGDEGELQACKNEYKSSKKDHLDQSLEEDLHLQSQEETIQDTEPEGMADDSLVNRLQSS
jgi:hypothetical protein